MRTEYIVVPISSISTGSLVRLGFVANLGIWLLFGLLVGLSGWAGYDTISWSGEQIYGPGALIVGMIFAFIISLIGTVLFVLGALVAKVFSRWLPVGDIELRPPKAAE